MLSWEFVRTSIVGTGAFADLLLNWFRLTQDTRSLALIFLKDGLMFLKYVYVYRARIILFQTRRPFSLNQNRMSLFRKSPKSALGVGVRLVVAFALCAGLLNAQEARRADLVFKNGAIYTSDAARTWADAVAIKDGKIIYVGPNSGVQQYVSHRTRVIDLQGKMLLPGFSDSHVHPVSSGRQLNDCVLTNISTVTGLLDAVQRCKQNLNGKKWLIGGGWELPIFENANPSKELLDRITSEIPVFLEAADGHSAWVNSKALAIAGVSKDTKDPERGRIERDKNGEPSGTLREAAMSLVARHIPEPTQNENVEGLRRALKLANSFGITALQDASASVSDLTAYKTLDAKAS